MTKVWKIISSTPRMGGGGAPLKQYFLVATSNQSAAFKALRDRRPDVEASRLTVAGEINTNNLEWQWLDLQEGQILVLEDWRKPFAIFDREPKLQPRMRGLASGSFSSGGSRANAGGKL